MLGLNLQLSLAVLGAGASVSIGLVGSAAAASPNIPPTIADFTSTTPRGERITLRNGRLSIIDAAEGRDPRVLIGHPTGVAHDQPPQPPGTPPAFADIPPVNMVYPSPLSVRIEAVAAAAAANAEHPQAGGLDLIISVTNSTAASHPVPSITIGRVLMDNVTVWNLSTVAKTSTWDLRPGRGGAAAADEADTPRNAPSLPPPIVPENPPSAPPAPTNTPRPAPGRLADPPALETTTSTRDNRPVAQPSSTGTVPITPPQLLTIHAANWPEEWYSPVMVFRDDRTTIGVSVMYDAVAYDQSIEMRLIGYRPAGDGPFAPGMDLRLTLLGEVPAGQTRTYRVALRMAGPSMHWLETLVPYRDYFRETYGGVSYTADPRPVAGEAFAHEHLLAADNPRGFQHPEMRPDLVGYGPWARSLRDNVPRRGFRRVMLWAVSGLYNEHRALNYPFNIITGVRGQEKMVRSLGELAAIAGPELSVGFWWGTTWDIKRGWDDGRVERLDLNNPELVAIANRELDAMVTLNATMIGLDAFPVRSPGQLHRWLSAMRARHPHVTFITEVSGPDLLHVLAPTWVNAYDASGPDILAHFLVPGHETWAGVRYDVIEKRTGQKLDAFDRFAEARRLADAGYVVMDLYGIAVNERLNASPAAAEIVPGHLRLPPAPPKIPVRRDGDSK